MASLCNECRTVYTKCYFLSSLKHKHPRATYKVQYFLDVVTLPFTVNQHVAPNGVYPTPYRLPPQDPLLAHYGGCCQNVEYVTLTTIVNYFHWPSDSHCAVNINIIYFFVLLKKLIFIFSLLKFNGIDLFFMS